MSCSPVCCFQADQFIGIFCKAVHRPILNWCFFSPLSLRLIFSVIIILCNNIKQRGAFMHCFSADPFSVKVCVNLLHRVKVCVNPFHSVKVCVNPFHSVKVCVNPFQRLDILSGAMYAFPVFLLIMVPLDRELNKLLKKI